MADITGFRQLTPEEVSGATTAQGWANVDLIGNQARAYDLANQGNEMKLNEARRQQQELNTFDQAMAEQMRNIKQTAQAPAPVAMAPQPVQTIQPVQRPVQVAQPVTTGDFARADRAIDQSAPAQSFAVPNPNVQARPLSQPAVTSGDFARADRAPATDVAVEQAAPPAQEQVQPSPEQSAPVVEKKLPSREEFEQKVVSSPVLPTGDINPLSADYVRLQQETLIKLVQDGKMRPSFAQQILETSVSLNNKVMKDQYDILVKMKTAEREGWSAEKLKNEIQVAKKEQMFDDAANIVNMMKTSPAIAQQYAAQSFGADQNGNPKVDLNNPQHLSSIMALAKQSKSEKEIAVEGRKEGLKRNERKQVPGTSYSMDGNGNVWKPDGSQETDDTKINGVIQASRKSGATTINTGDGADPYAAGDKKFAEKAGEGDVALLEGYRAKSETYKQMIGNYKTILGTVTDEKGNVKNNLPLGPGQGFNALFQRMGLTDKKDQDLFAVNTVKTASAALELDAAGAMKGQGAISEGERDILRRAKAGDIANFTPSEWKMFAEAQIKYHNALINQNNTNIDNIGKRRKNFDVSTYKLEMPAETAATKKAPSVDAIASKWGQYGSK